MDKIKTYIINMKLDLLKKQYMVESCSKYTDLLDIEFIEAIDGNNLERYDFIENYDNERANKFLNRSLTKGEKGCLLSHVYIYHKIVNENIDIALIFEDDIILSEEFRKVITLIKNYPKDWELVLYGHYSFYINEEIRSPISRWGTKELSEEFNLYRLAYYGYGTHSYLINKKGARSLLKTLRNFYLPIDHYTNNQKYINVYALIPTVVKVNSNFNSNIEIDRGRKTPWFKKIKLLWYIRNLFYYFSPPKDY